MNGEDRRQGEERGGFDVVGEGRRCVEEEEGGGNRSRCSSGGGGGGGGVLHTSLHLIPQMLLSIQDLDLKSVLQCVVSTPSPPRMFPLSQVVP